MTIEILTTNDIKTKLDGTWVGDAYNQDDPCDICSEMLELILGNAGYQSLTNPLVSGYVNLQPIRNIYLHDSNIGSYSTIGIYGAMTIIKLIPVTADYNCTIIDNAMAGSDFIDTSRVTLKQLEFRI